MILKHLTDQTLLTDTKDLAQKYREVTTRLLHHLKEIERRRLFAELGYPSMFEYVVKELGFSEPSAARRINAARLLAEIPDVEKKIETGEVSLTNLSNAFKTIKEENITDPKIKQEIVKRIENTSARQCASVLQEFRQKELVPQVQTSSYTFEFDDETLDLFNKLRGVLAHRRFNQNELIKTIFTSALKALTQGKYKLMNTRITTSKNPRHVTAALKKEIYEEASGKCTNCGSTYALEIDHIRPYALGGKTIKENLRLLCRSCNQRHKIRHFGQGNASAHRGKR